MTSSSSVRWPFLRRMRSVMPSFSPSPSQLTEF